MTKAAAIEARGLTKCYGAVRAVSDVSFRVEPGEILGCLGPNGSGKSTTMRMLSGLMDPTRGEILFAGERISKDLVDYKRRLGYVPEETRLYPYLSGLEYLTLAGQLRGIAAKALGAKIDWLLELFALRSQRHTALAAYSKGMQQKILIVAALLHDPDILLFDEPLSGLDITSALIFQELLRQLAGEGKAILLCSHVPEIIEKLCSRVLIFHRGRIAANDTIKKLRQMQAQPSLERVFVQMANQPDAERTAQVIVRVMRAR